MFTVEIYHNKFRNIFLKFHPPTTPSRRDPDYTQLRDDVNAHGDQLLDQQGFPVESVAWDADRDDIRAVGWDADLPMNTRMGDGF